MLLQNKSEINYIGKWLKAHNLVLIDKHILTCLFLPKTMIVTQYDHVAHFVIVQRTVLKTNEKWMTNDGFLSGFPEESIIQDAPWV